MTKNELLIIFTKNPEYGKVKTRLAKDIGHKTALEIYEFLLAHSQQITAALKMDKQVYYSSRISENDLWNEGGFEKKLQCPGDLGERMKTAFKEGFQHGYQKIVIIGTDMYDISTGDIQNAFNELENHDHVIGPAEDGGYYLLGMKSLNSDLFRNKKWSTSSVFEDSMKDIQGARVKILPEKNDIDMLVDIEDHQAFQKFLKYDRQN